MCKKSVLHHAMFSNGFPQKMVIYWHIIDTIRARYIINHPRALSKWWNPGLGGLLCNFSFKQWSPLRTSSISTESCYEKKYPYNKQAVSFWLSQQNTFSADYCQAKVKAKRTWAEMHYHDPDLDQSLIQIFYDTTIGHLLTPGSLTIATFSPTRNTSPHAT